MLSLSFVSCMTMTSAEDRCVKAMNTREDGNGPRAAFGLGYKCNGKSPHGLRPFPKVFESHQKVGKAVESFIAEQRKQPGMEPIERRSGL